MLFFSRTFRLVLGLNQPPIQRVQGSFQRRKVACTWGWPLISVWSEADHSSLPGSEVKNEGSYAPIPPYAFMACTGKTLMEVKKKRQRPGLAQYPGTTFQGQRTGTKKYLGEWVTWLSFEPGTSRLQATSVTAWVTLLVLRPFCCVCHADSCSHIGKFNRMQPNTSWWKTT